MPAISAIAGVDSRIAAIRNRIGAQTSASSGDVSAANLSVRSGGRSDPTESFDPFGSAYQLALQQAGITPSSQAGGFTSAGFTSGTASGPESYSASSSSSGGAVRVAGVQSYGVGSTSTSTVPQGSLSGEQIAQVAYNAGFRGQDLVNVVAISKRESNWRPSAFNGNSSTGDLSYGLMQINMKGALGPARLGQLGLSTNEQLLDAQTNMNAAFKLYSDSGNSLNAWGGYKGMSNTYGTDIAAAQQVVADAHLGSEL